MHNFHMKRKTGPNSNIGSSRFKILNTIKSMDIFGRPMPGFNIKGTKQVHSLLGSVCTLMIFITVLMYASAKFVQLHVRHNPNISTYEEAKFYSKDDPMNLNQVNFRFAISFEGYHDSESKFDSQFVRWMFRHYYSENGVIKEKFLKHHRCTEEDYNQFYPIWDE